MAEYNFTRTESGAQPFINTLGQGLEALAHAKIGQLQQHQQGKDLASILGISEQQANALARQKIDINKLLQNIAQYGGGPQEGGAGIPGQDQGGNLLDKFNNKNKPLSPQQQQHRDAIASQFSNLEQLVQATDEAMGALKSGKAELGLWPKIASNIAPGQLLEDETQGLLGNISNIVNLRGENLKGLQSKYRLQNLEKDKLDLNLGLKENLKRADRINKEAKHKISQIQQDYPNYDFKSILGELENSQLPGQSQAPQQSFQQESEIDELPKEGSPEFNALPQNWAAESDGIIYKKVGNRWQKSKAK